MVDRIVNNIIYVLLIIACSTLFLLLFSCGVKLETYRSKDLESYISEVEQTIDINLSDLTILLAVNDDDNYNMFDGLYILNTHIILINNKVINNYEEHQILAIILHELGHYAKGSSDHNNKLDDNGCPLSTMYKEASFISLDCWNTNKDKYYQEIKLMFQNKQ